jgi:hypothetical protein
MVQLSDEGIVTSPRGGDGWSRRGGRWSWRRQRSYGRNFNLKDSFTVSKTRVKRVLSVVPPPSLCNSIKGFAWKLIRNRALKWRTTFVVRVVGEI